MADWIAVGLAAAAFVLSLVSFEFSKKTAEMEALATQGSLEHQMRSSINDAYYNITRFATLVSEKPEDEIYRNAYLGAEEVYRNTYEDACDKYLRGKVDRDSFKRMYFVEIRRLVEEEPHKKMYSDNQSPYTATLGVYKEWYRS